MGRKKSLGAKYSKLEKDVSKYLSEKGVSDLTDYVLIDELIFNVYIADQARESIRELGILVNVRSDESLPPLMQTNQAVSTYNQAIKTVQAICTKLGMTVQERTKLKLEGEKEDSFEAMFSKKEQN